MKKQTKLHSNQSILLKNSNILDILNGKSSVQDILIKNGKIVDLGKIKNVENCTVINCKDKIVTQAFIDIHAHLNTPGTGDQETLKSGSISALSGGYSKICIMPDTNPVIDNPELINFIFDQSNSLPVQIYPIGAITKNLNGIDIAELGSMINAGAIAISDASNSLMNSQVARYAIEYAKMFNVPFINHPEDKNLVNKGLMNESITSNNLGLAGNPSISESIMVYRDLEIAHYVEGKIHIPNVTCSESIDLIDRYKNKKTAISCEASPQHLFFKDSDLKSYDSNLKISPPLRSDNDIDSIIKGLKNGVIDCIASNHQPHRFDDKDKDFLLFWEKEDTKLRRKIIRARKKLDDVKLSNEILESSAKLCLALGSDGLRGELTLIRTSKAQASFENKDSVEISHLRKVASICLGHRLRKDPLDDVGSNIRVERTIEEVLGK